MTMIIYYYVLDILSDNNVMNYFGKNDSTQPLYLFLSTVQKIVIRISHAAENCPTDIYVLL